MTTTADYSHVSDRAFRIVFPVMLVGFGAGATYCWLGGHHINAIALTLLALLAFVSLLTSLRLGVVRQQACAVIATELSERAVDEVLDMGTGKGLLAIHLAKAGLTAVGEDIAADDLAIARQNASAEEVDVDFVAGEPTSLGVEAASFDAVTSLQMLHEVKDKGALLRSAHEALRPGGHLVMADFRRSPGTFALMWFAMLKALGSGTLAQLLTEAGFTEAATRPITSLHQLIVATKPE